MKRRRTKGFTISEFYCTECGNLNFNLARPDCQRRPAGHLKKLWCFNCKKEVNCAEVSGFGKYTKEAFLTEFTSGVFVNGERVTV